MRNFATSKSPGSENCQTVPQQSSPFLASSRAPLTLSESKTVWLSRCEVGVKEKASLCGYNGFMASCFQLIADVGCASVLPDYGIIDWSTSCAIPDDRSLARWLVIPTAIGETSAPPMPR